jgi:putative aldouronate transport system substrate-binding protein
MRKLILFLIAVLCVSSAVSAAGNRARTSGGAKPVVGWYTGVIPPTVVEDMKIISRYAEDKIGIGLEFVSAEDAAREVMVQSGQPFDIMNLDAGPFLAYVDMGGCADITDLVKSQTPALWNSMPAALWAAGTYRNRIYAVPIYKDVATTAFTIWDTRSIGKYGLQSYINDTTIPGLDRTFREIKRQDPSFYITIGRGNDFQLGRLIDGMSSGIASAAIFGVRLDDRSRRVISPMQDDPQFIEGLKSIRQWYVDGLFSPDQSTNPNPWLPPDLGAPIFTHGSGWPSAASIWAGWNHNPDGTTPVETWMGPWNSTDATRNAMNFIGANSPHTVESLKILELASTDPLFRDMLAYGIEGKHFTYITRPVGQTPGVLHKTGAAWEGPYAYKTGAWFIETASGTKPVISSTDDDLNRLGEVADQNARARTSVMMGFTMDVSNLLTEITNVNAVWDRYGNILFGGVEDPAVLIPRIMAELNAVGLQRIKDEAQRQVNEWARTNPLP